MQTKCMKLVQIAPFLMTALGRVIKTKDLAPKGINNNNFGAKRHKE